MVKFAHIADCHLGGWKQKPLQDLNLQCFKTAIDTCIKEKVEFVMIAGDLFDSAYPPIEILKQTFSVFRKLKESKIPCFIISGSHDYSVSGKTFLDVLEHSGFCKNVENFEERDGFIYLSPTVYGEVALYGYPGKMSGLEVPDLRRVKFQESPGLFNIFMLHTTMSRAKGTLPIDSVDEDKLPKADYYALGHIHVDFQYDKFVYPSPTFPNNFKELEDLQCGGFYIAEATKGIAGYETTLKKVSLKLKEVETFEIEIDNSLTATEKILLEINSRDIENKIVLLRIKGDLNIGKHSDIKFADIEQFVNEKKAYFFLRNTHDLKTKEVEIEIETKEAENVEEETIKMYVDENPSKLNELILQLMGAFGIEKQDDEKSSIFEDRLIGEVRKILNF